MPRLRAELEGSELAAKFDRIYEESLKIWDEPYMWQFTDHGKAHTDQVERNLDALTRPMQRKDSENRLTKDEIFVLLSAACLHDIGMQRIDDPHARENHAEYSYDLILNSSAQIGSEQRQVKLSIDDWNAREAIAIVARAHWTDYALALPRTHYINNQNCRGRLKLLGLLLAMADLLDLSPIRARYFLSPNRLYDLPPESMLHHKIHRHVHGVRIRRPNRRVPHRLQFWVNWNGNESIVEDMNEWVMQWFDSQWRQLEGPLFAESDDRIHWIKPWRKFQFREQIGDVPSLTPTEFNILKAKRADQVRIDRDEFASRFRESLEGKVAIVFLAPSESDFDTYISDWCEANAWLREDYRVTRINVEPQLSFDAGTVANNIMKQLDQTLPADADPSKALEYFLSQADNLNLVSIVKIHKTRKTDLLNDSLHNLLRTLVLRPSSTAGRVLLLICPQESWLPYVPNAQSVVYDESELPLDQIKQHLLIRGYSSAKIAKICGTIEKLKLQTKPSDLYTYIEEHYVRLWSY